MNETNKPWYKKWWGITLLILLTFSLALSVAFGLLIINLIKNPIVNQQLKKQSDLNIPKTITGTDNYWLGSANPEITIVEFSDFACPFCKASFPNIRELGIKYKKDIKVIFRDFPAISNYSQDLALAARCAGEQGLFWVMHDKLFLNQGVSTAEEIKELAKQIGINQEKFSTCYDNKKYLDKIQKDYLDGQSLGIAGTPTWFINGQKISGDIPLSKFEEIIQNLIK